MHQALLKQSHDEKDSYEARIRQLKRNNAALKTEIAHEKGKKEGHLAEIQRLQELCDKINASLDEKERDIDQLKRKMYQKYMNEERRSVSSVSTAQDTQKNEPNVGGRKKYSREESISSFIGLQGAYEGLDENKENVDFTTRKASQELCGFEDGQSTEDINGTELEQPGETNSDSVSKTLKEKEEAVRKCGELELLLRNARARELEMRRRNLRDRATSFGDAPLDMDRQSESKYSSKPTASNRKTLLFTCNTTPRQPPLLPPYAFRY